MKLTESGNLTVRAYVANGAKPVEDVLIRIRGSDEDNRFVVFSILTDRDGITDNVVLPAPDAKYSLSPYARERAYSTYDVEVIKSGYYTKRIYNVAIFSGIHSELPVNMIPESLSNEDGSFPRDNLDAYVKENENLE